MSKLTIRWYDESTWAMRDFESWDTVQIGMMVRVLTSWNTTLTGDDQILSVEKTVWSVTTVTLPPWYTWAYFVIQDWKGDAATNNITIAADWSEKINGQSSILIFANWWNAVLRWNWLEWRRAVLSAQRSFNNAPWRSIVTDTWAVWFQLSTLRDANVTYSINIESEFTWLLGWAERWYVVLEIAATNSATAVDWKEIARVTNGQAVSSLLSLSWTQNVWWVLAWMVPAWRYVKLRSVNVTWTPTYTYNSWQEVLL